MTAQRNAGSGECFQTSGGDNAASSGKGARNLVLGAAFGYDWLALRNFVRSFKSCCSGEVALIVRDVDGPTLERLRAEGVLTVPARTLPHMHACQHRYFEYLDFLEERPEYRYVFLTDVRDAAAQADIFASPLAVPGLHVFEEDPGMSVGGSSLNTRWLTDWYGAEAAAALAGERIICSGTTLGDRKALCRYLRLMIDEFRLKMAGSLALLYEGGYDQGVHNYLVRTGRLAEALAGCRRRVHIHRNGDGVLTAAYKEGGFFLSRTRGLLNDAGEKVRVVHQYDRFPVLREMFDAAWALPEE